MKEMLSQTFNTPKNHPKSKPFIDHVISFTYHEGKVWLRNYQILNAEQTMFKAGDDIQKLVLIEIGPRFTMTPIKCFEESLGGPALWQNHEYIAPTKLRSKRYEEFSKKRDKKLAQKDYYEQIRKDGKDPDAYLGNAFESSNSEESESDE